MKNAMKKLTSLLLVALLLVGMIPFAASAATTVNVTANGYPKTLTVDGSVVLDTATAQSLVTKSTISGATWTSPFGDATGKTLTEEGINEYNAANPGAPYSLTMSFTTADNGTTDNGTTDNGTTDNGTTDNGTTDNGTTDNGTTDNGTTDNGTTNNGTTNNGTTDNGTTTIPEVKPITVVIKVDNSNNVVAGPITKVPSNGEYALVENLLSYCWNSSWEGVYTFSHAWSKVNNNTSSDVKAKIYAGDEVHIMLKTKSSSNSGTGNTGNNNAVVSATLQVSVNGVSKVNSKATVGKTVSALLAASNLDYASAWTSYYTVNSVKINGVSYNRVDITVNSGDAVEVALTRNYSKDNSHKVYLHVYLNGNAGTIAKTLDITGTYLMYDWATDVNEVKNYLSANFYNAANSNGLELDGLYISAGHFPTNYYSNNKQTSYTADALKNDLENNHVNISVMLKNAVVKGSAAADKSNPKTGDSIYVAMTVMGVSAASLAAVMYFYNKKRMAL